MSKFLSSLWDLLSSINEIIAVLTGISGAAVIAYSWLKAYPQRFFLTPISRVRLMLFPLRWDLNESEKAKSEIKNGISKLKADIV